MSEQEAWDEGFTACAGEHMRQREDPSHPITRTNPYLGSAPAADEREAFRAAVGGVLVNAANYPDSVGVRVLGRDMGALIDKVTDAVLAVRRPEPVTPEPDVLVEGSWFAVADLPEILGKHMQAIEAYRTEAKDTYLRALVAEKKVAELEAAIKELAPAPVTPETETEWEYATTTGPRKRWDDEMRPPEGDGWEVDTTRGRDGWERFDYHEERYWRRRLPVEDGGE